MKLLPTLALISVFLFVVSCQQETNDDLEQLRALEASLENAEATPDQLQELTDKYLEYLEKHPEDHESNSKHLQTLARIQYDNARYSGAIGYLKQALRDHYVKKSAAAQMLFLGTIYKDKLNNQLVGNSAYWSFAQAFPDHDQAQSITDSLLSDYPGIPAQLDSLSGQLYDEQNARIDYSKANQFIDVSEVYALGMPDAADSPEILSEAAKVAGYVNAHGRALEIYDWVYSNYPEHQRAGQAIFMMGFIHDNEAEFQDKEKAKAYYETFIQEYPEDDFADDATFLLQNLNKTNEEIMNEFEGN